MGKSWGAPKRGRVTEVRRGKGKGKEKGEYHFEADVGDP